MSGFLGLNEGGCCLLGPGGRPILTRSIPAGGSSVESSVIDAPQDVGVLIEAKTFNEIFMNE